jgi:hypothetical protein
MFSAFSCNFAIVGIAPEREREGEGEREIKKRVLMKRV